LDNSRVVYHGVTSSFFGIGILPVSDLTGRSVFRSVWGLLYGTDLISFKSFCDVIFSLTRKICYTQYINYKKNKCCMVYGGGVVIHILWSMVQFQSKIFTSRLVECMNSSNIRIHLYYEFIYFLQCK
jgi:hypothetical protein